MNRLLRKPVVWLPVSTVLLVFLVWRSHAVEAASRLTLVDPGPLIVAIALNWEACPITVEAYDIKLPCLYMQTFLPSESADCVMPVVKSEKAVQPGAGIATSTAPELLE